MTDLIQQGIAALKAGNKALAHRMLQQVTRTDPANPEGWLWLAEAAENETERVDCLKQVLRLDPENPLAARALAKPGANSGGFSGGATSSSRLSSIAGKPSPSSDPYASPYRGVSASSSAAQPAPASDSLGGLRSAFDPPTPTPAPATSKNNPPARKMTRTTKPDKTVMIAAAGLGVLVLLTLCMGVYLFSQFQKSASPQPALVAQVEQGSPMPSQTPSRTPEPTTTPTLTPTPKPTRTVTPTETYVPLGPTAQLQSQSIQRQVSELRGLPIANEVPLYIVNRERADRLLRSRYITDQEKTELLNTQRSLTALGLIDPGYDLVTNTLNHLVDNIGGFYTGDTQEIFLLGLRFGGVEHYVYSHEFDHALVDQNFAKTSTSLSLGCTSNTDSCLALTGLMEGDAQLLMSQWSKKFANQQDARDILMFRPPLLALTEQYTPPFVMRDATFPYEKGLDFVKYLYNKGKWAQVDKAYLAPPTTSEQILHPVKFISGEAAIPMVAPPIEAALGPDWQTIHSDTMGEWFTFLMLGFSADANTQVEQGRASEAAAGWGGDHYQVYFNSSKDTTALAAKWVWDTDKDAAEFYTALLLQLDARFHLAKLDRPAGECWSTGQQVSCAYFNGTSTLWLLAPDTETLDLMLALYPDFK